MINENQTGETRRITGFLSKHTSVDDVSPGDGVTLKEGGERRSVMLEEVEQDIDGETAEEVDAVGAQER